MKITSARRLLNGVKAGLFEELGSEYRRLKGDSFEQFVNEEVNPESLISGAFTWTLSLQDRLYWLELSSQLKEKLGLYEPYRYWFLRDLPDKDLWKSASKIYYFRKKDGRTCVAAHHAEENEFHIYAGCFVGTVEEFIERAISEYGDHSVANYSKHWEWLRGLEKKHLNP